MSYSITIQTRTPEETRKLGELIGRQAQPGDIYLLTGPLGAGKTCLTQGVGLGLEVPDRLRSPTFVLMTRRQGRLRLDHLDLYRIEDPAEVWDLGVDELLFGEGVCIVEWADKAAELFPPESCWISMDYGSRGPNPEELEFGESLRTLTITGCSTRYESLLQLVAAAFTPLLSTDQETAG